MFQNSKHLIKTSQNPDNWILAIVFFTPAFFLVLKSVATTGLFLVFFISCWAIFKEPRKYIAKRGTRFWVIVVCLLSPFLAELLAQFGRGHFLASSLDGPSRAILAVAIFVYLSKKYCGDLILALRLGSGFGIVLLVAYLLIFPEDYWGSRAATYFVDPITLPCFAVVLLGMFLFGRLPKISKPLEIIFKFSITMLTVYVAVESSSRSSWVAGFILLEAFILYSFRHSFRKQLVANLFLLAGAIALFQMSAVVSTRALEAIYGLVDFFNYGEGQDTSSVQRVLMVLIDIELLRQSPFLGTQDGVMPTFEYLKSMIPNLDRQTYTIKTLAGSHSELFAQLVRKGIFLGGFTLWGYFVYPMYLVFRKNRSASSSFIDPRGILLGLVLPVLMSGLTIQVFNLKMTTSFYLFCMTILLAYIFQENEAHRGEAKG
jgi:O-antigen ligase